MSALNDLAIVLTKKIEQDLVIAFMSQKHHSPSFFNIRETILATLRQNMEVLSVEMKDSPMMLKDMPVKQREDYTNYQLEKCAHEVVKLIMKGDEFFEKYEFKDEYDHYRNVTRTIAVVKTGKIARESREIRKNLRVPT